MHIMTLFTLLLLSACASSVPGGPQGGQQKSDWNALNKTVSPDVIYLKPRTGQCARGRILHCSLSRSTGSQSAGNCRCMDAHAVDARTDRLSGLHQRGQNRHGQAYRQHD
jgi:hypothetical protein